MSATARILRLEADAMGRTVAVVAVTHGVVTTIGRLPLDEPDAVSAHPFGSTTQDVPFRVGPGDAS